MSTAFLKHFKFRHQEAWVELLSQFAWHWYITHTFRESVHPERADKLWRVWCSQINRYLYGPQWYKKGRGVYWVRALEYQRRDVIHYHALMLGCESLNTYEWQEKWLNLDGFGTKEGLTGISRIYPYEQFNNTESIISYVSKYVIKKGDLELSPNIAGYTRKLSQAEPSIKS